MDPRWRTVLTVTPYLVLGMLAAFALGVEWGAWQQLVPTLVLCATVAAWILVLRDLALPWRDRPAAIAVFMAGLIALNLTLVLRDSWFGFLTVATFSFAYSIVPWPWKLLAVGATATVAGLAQSSDLGHDRAGVTETVAVVALNVVVMCGLAWGLRLAQQQQVRMATEVERARLAREIHDALAQGFAGIVTQLQAGEQAPDEAARRRHTDAALALARDGLAEARRSVQALRPTALDTSRLPEALENVTRTWSARTGIVVQVDTSGDGRALPTDAEVALLRTVQEALTNIERHAGAHRVVVSLRSGADGTHLEVRDDGRGFDPSEQPALPGRPEEGGYGLVAMRERIESIAGELVVESRPGHGTAVLAEVPR
ncbi:MAG TPA: sensor histidine kinase [Nocardioidaceae bacterium]